MAEMMMVLQYVVPFAVGSGMYLWGLREGKRRQREGVTNLQTILGYAYDNNRAAYDQRDAKARAVEDWRQWVRLVFTHLSADAVAKMSDHELQAVVAEAAERNGERPADHSHCLNSTEVKATVREWARMIRAAESQHDLLVIADDLDVNASDVLRAEQC